MRRRLITCCAVQMFFDLLIHSTSALGELNVVAMVGDPIPGRSDLLSPYTLLPLGLKPFVLNDQGQVAFGGMPSSLRVEGNLQTGMSVYRGDIHGFTEVARPGDLAPDGQDAYGLVSFQAMNDTGDVLFYGDYGRPYDYFTGKFGYYRWRGGSVVTMAQAGDIAPDGNGIIPKFTSLTRFGRNVFNDAGIFAYSVALSGTVGGTADQYVFVESSGVQSALVARSGEVLPGGSAIVTRISYATINDLGQSAFLASLSLSGQTRQALYREEGATFTEIYHYGQLSPKGDGELSGIGDFAFNNVGQAAFYSSVVIDPNDNWTWKRALFRADENGMIELARTGDPAPDGNGQIRLPLEDRPTFNDRGQAAFYATLTGTSGGAADDAALFRVDESGLVQIARDGQLAPSGNGWLVMSESSLPEMNDSGQLVFNAGLTSTSGGAADSGAMFFWSDETGLTELFRIGDALLGSTITGLRLPVINNLGQIAFGFTLSDGRQGIAIYSIPEPTTIALVLMGVLILRGVISQRRRNTQQ